MDALEIIAGITLAILFLLRKGMGGGHANTDGVRPRRHGGHTGAIRWL